MSRCCGTKKGGGKIQGSHHQQVAQLVRIFAVKPTMCMHAFVRISVLMCMLVFVSLLYFEKKDF
jgi:hypothetical protein